MSIPLGRTAQDFLRQQRLAPERDESPGIKIFRVQGPQTHRASLADAAFARPRKLDQMQNFRQGRQFLLNFCQRVGDGQAFAEQNFIGPFHGVLRFFGNSIPLHADFVDGARLRRIAVRQHEGRHVLHDF